MPWRRIQPRFLPDATADRSVALATYFGLLIALIPSIGGFVDALEGGSILSGAAWGLLLLLVAFWFLNTILTSVYTPLPPPIRFQPFAPPEVLNPWPRHDDVDRVRSKILNAGHTLPVVAGPSGAGKTTILRNLLPESLQRYGIQTIYIDDYSLFFEDFVEKLKPYKAASSGVEKPLVILDQFEQLLAQLRESKPADRHRLQQRLAELINEALANCHRIVISLRFEWFYELRVLGDLIPAPSQCIHISGPLPEDTRDETLARIIAEFRIALDDAELAGDIVNELGDRGPLLMLQTQIVGATLESLKASGVRLSPEYVRRTLGGVNGAIDRYFDDVLSSAPNRRVALKVLAALSTATRFRRQVRIADIYDVVFEASDAVGEAIRYLKGRRIIIDRGANSELELCHDFLAEYFQTRCGYELRPTDRDNVVLHLEAGVPNMGKAVQPRPQREAQRAPVGWAVFGIVGLASVVRLIGFGIPWTRIGSIEPTYLTGRIFDITYVPIFFAHGAWMIYVTLFYTRIFVMLDEGGFARLLTHMVSIFMGACVVVAYFIPYAWVCSVGLGGFFLGVKLLTLSRNTQLSAVARERFRQFGRSTLVTLGMLAATGLGVVWLSLTLQNEPHFEQQWIALNLLASTVMTILCGILTPYHVVSAAVSEYLGLLARSPRGAAPRTDTSLAMG